MPCLEMHNQLLELNQQKISTTEKIAAFLVSGIFITPSLQRDEKILKQKITILKMKLKSCKNKL